MATKHTIDISAGDLEWKLLCDLDLATFSLPFAQYYAHTKNVIAECKAFGYSDEQVTEGRKKFLTTFKKDLPFYWTNFFLFDEQQARANIQQELEKLDV